MLKTQGAIRLLLLYGLAEGCQTKLYLVALMQPFRWATVRDLSYEDLPCLHFDSVSFMRRKHPAYKEAIFTLIIFAYYSGLVT